MKQIFSLFLFLVSISVTAQNTGIKDNSKTHKILSNSPKLIINNLGSPDNASKSIFEGEGSAVTEYVTECSPKYDAPEVSVVQPFCGGTDGFINIIQPTGPDISYLISLNGGGTGSDTILGTSFYQTTRILYIALY